jgi:hypothetical protein
LWKKSVDLSSDLSPKKQTVTIPMWLLYWFPLQVSLAEGHKFDQDVEFLIYYSEVHSSSVAMEMGMPDMNPGISFSLCSHLLGCNSALKMLSYYSHFSFPLSRIQ